MERLQNIYYKNRTIIDHSPEFTIWDQNKINGFMDKILIGTIVKNNFNVRISTLGPPGTSSEYASNYFLDLLNINSKADISLRLSFEEAIEDVLKKKSHVAIVANAYSHIDSFYMNSELCVLSSFICPTPNYGIACRNRDTRIDEGEISIITHPAPISLIPWFLDGKSITYKVERSSSTSKAAEKVKNGEFKYCVTNENAVKLYNLHFISRVRPIQMLWTVFGLGDGNLKNA